MPFHASQMFAKNMQTLVAHLVKDGKFQLDMTDEITRETLVARDGQVVNPRVRAALGLPAVEKGGCALSDRSVIPLP